MPNSFLGKAVPLSQQGFDSVLQQLGVDAPSLWALVTVETRGFGFLPDRRPKILFERHIFHKRTGGRFSAANPDISSAVSGGYEGGAAEYARLERAIELDRRAALESTSWGLPQIMGFNAVKLRYIGADEMATQFLDGEDVQLDGALRFIRANPALEAAFRDKVWKKVAFFYNGAAYAKNAYDAKLEHYCELYRLQGTPNIDVRAAQVRLTYLGFNPRGVDGLLGDGTRTAIIAFQKARSINVTADLDARTMDELKISANV